MSAILFSSSTASDFHSNTEGQSFNNSYAEPKICVSLIKINLDDPSTVTLATPEDFADETITVTTNDSSLTESSWDDQPDAEYWKTYYETLGKNSRRQRNKFSFLKRKLNQASSSDSLWNTVFNRFVDCARPTTTKTQEAEWFDEVPFRRTNHLDIHQENDEAYSYEDSSSDEYTSEIPALD